MIESTFFIIDFSSFAFFIPIKIDILYSYNNNNNNMKHPECSICYEPLVNDTIILPCNHVFHNTCMNSWVNINNNNSCPYCRFSLNTLRVPTTYYDNLIQSDGNIENLTVDNFRYFYYINTNAYTNEQILNLIHKIHQAHEIKSRLRLCENYEIKAIGRANFKHEIKFGKLIHIGQIQHNGNFPCTFQTENGIQYGFSCVHQFIEIK